VIFTVRQVYRKNIHTSRAKKLLLISASIQKLQQLCMREKFTLPSLVACVGRPNSVAGRLQG